MTTVVDPAGTPIPFYNLSGKTVVRNIQGGQGSPNPSNPSSDNCTPLVSYSGVMLVGILANSSGRYVALPVGANVGDEVWAFQEPSSTTGAGVLPPTGESIASLPTSTGTNLGTGVDVDSTSGLVFVKVSTTNWQIF